MIGLVFNSCKFDTYFLLLGNPKGTELYPINILK